MVIILDFIIAAEAVERFNDAGFWRYSDRDFVLTLTPSMLREMKTGTWQGGGRLFGLRERMYDPSETYLSGRQLQITIGVVVNYVALAGAAGVGVCAALLLFMGRCWLVQRLCGLRGRKQWRGRWMKWGKRGVMEWRVEAAMEWRKGGMMVRRRWGDGSGR